MKEHLRKLAELQAERDQNEATWLRHILTLAAGALALLASFAAKEPSEGLAQSFLVATWICLAIGIGGGAAATYGTTDLARRLADTHREQINNWIETGQRMELVSRVQMNWWLRKCKVLMLVSLLAGVLCLTAYAIITTLGL